MIALNRQRHRKEDEEKSAAQESVPPPDHLKLVGTIQLPERKEAFFTDARQGGKTIRAGVGEEVGEYRLTRADNNSVTLTLPQGQEARLSLEVQRGEEAAKAPRMSASRFSQPRKAPSTQKVRNEEKALRQQIRQLHRRLRKIRRQRAAAKRQARRASGEQ